jgi:hypothetical protein
VIEAPNTFPLASSDRQLDRVNVRVARYVFQADVLDTSSVLMSSFIGPFV